MSKPDKRSASDRRRSARSAEGREHAMSETKKPTPVAERCAKCSQPWGEHVGDGHDEPICPDPPAPVADGGEILSDEAFSRLCVEGSHCVGIGIRDEARRARTSEAALRAEVERLREGHPWDVAEQKVRSDLIAERDVEKARADRLAEALREIAESCCYLDTDYKAIAAAALRREEEK